MSEGLAIVSYLALVFAYMLLDDKTMFFGFQKNFLFEFKPFLAIEGLL